jgi:hypothetical protein
VEPLSRFEPGDFSRFSEERRKDLNAWKKSEEAERFSEPY